jgi:hypothetical protein
VQLITTSSGIPVEFLRMVDTQADIKGLHQLPFSLPIRSKLYAG